MVSKIDMRADVTDFWHLGWARCRRALFAFAVGTGFVLLFYGGVARAEVQGVVADGQFEAEAQGALGVAVDQSATESDPSRGDVYVAGFFTEHVNLENPGVFGQINKFDASGKLLSPPSPFGISSSFFEPGATYSGAAVNPVNGNVYALGNKINSQFKADAEIDVYDPATGEPLASFSVPPSRNFQSLANIGFTVVGIASDSAGDVYVPVAPENKVLEYDPSTCPKLPEPCALTPVKTFTGGSGVGALRGPSGVAVDPAGNVWVADTGNGRIEELTPSDEPVPGSEIAAEGVGSVALDSDGDVFAIVNNGVDPCGKVQPACSHLLEYSPTGTRIADLGAGSIGADQFNERGVREPVPDMVAVSDSTGLVYVTEAVFAPAPGLGFGRVLRFRPPVAPKLEGETATEVGVSEAKLGAVVNPGGLSSAYRFEYGPTTSYGRAVPFPEGDTGAGFTSRTVWASASGLAPGTTYHYRVVVTSAGGGSIDGEDHTFTTGTAAQAACPNEQFRTGFSGALPDCRAYELVTPPNNQSAQPDGNVGGNGGGELELPKVLAGNFAAVDGSRLSFNALDVRPGSPSGGESYVATRSASGWSEENMFPSTNYYGYKCPEAVLSPAATHYSDDLSHAIVSVPAGGECGVEPELVEGEPRGSKNLFVRDNATGTYRLIDIPEEGVAGFVPAIPTLLGESSDFSRVVFAEEAKLTKEAPAGANDVYEWNAGHVRLASVLPDGAPVAGSFVGMSSDGSRVFFSAAGSLYVRVDGAETVQLDASQAGGAGGGSSFLAASHDGSVVLFTDDASAGLTADTVPGSGTNLYRYDAGAPAGQRLADLTPVAHAEAPALAGVSKDGSTVFFTDESPAALTADTVSGSGTNLYRYDAGAPAGERLADLTPTAPAEVKGVLGVSEDGSSVYFKAEGVLTSQPNQYGETAQGGQSNLYLFRGGASTFITVLGGDTFRLSANGGFLAFESTGKLTPYDNVNPSTGRAALELYLYDAVANSLACASCNPSGEPPTAGGAGPQGPKTEAALGDLSENGQVFFDSPEGLLPADTNASSGCLRETGYPACDDVYEFEPSGAGSCSEPAGCLSLISTGTGSSETFLIDASASGNDVFIREFQKLVPGDSQDGAPSLYDVRVNGGLPEPSPPPPCTTADACRTAPAPQPGVFGAPASQTFSGAGNLVSALPAVSTPKPKAKCRKGYVKNKKHKCVKAKRSSKRRNAKKTNHKGSK